MDGTQRLNLTDVLWWKLIGRRRLLVSVNGRPGTLCKSAANHSGFMLEHCGFPDGFLIISKSEYVEGTPRSVGIENMYTIPYRLS